MIFTICFLINDKHMMTKSSMYFLVEKMLNMQMSYIYQKTYIKIPKTKCKKITTC